MLRLTAGSATAVAIGSGKWPSSRLRTNRTFTGGVPLSARYEPVGQDQALPRRLHHQKLARPAVGQRPDGRPSQRLHDDAHRLESARRLGYGSRRDGHRRHRRGTGLRHSCARLFPRGMERSHPSFTPNGSGCCFAKLDLVIARSRDTKTFRRRAAPARPIVTKRFKPWTALSNTGCPHLVCTKMPCGKVKSGCITLTFQAH